MTPDNIIAVRKNKIIYRDGAYTVKLFDEVFSTTDVLNEACNLAIVGETGFAVPRLEEVKKIDGKWAIVSEFIEGRSLHEMMQADRENMDAYMSRFVDVQLQMHAFVGNKRLRHHTDKMHGKIDECGLDATARYELHTRLNALPRHAKLCHGDFTPGNVIVTPDDRVYVIDWAHATQGNASADAARTYLRFRLGREDGLAETYLGLFCERSDTARQYVRKWLSIVAASQLVKGIPEERDMLIRWANVVEYE